MMSKDRTSQRGPGHCAADSEALTAYLLNALEPEEQLAVRSHLEDCDVCYLEYTSLAVLPDLLDSLSFDDIRDLTAPEPSAAASAVRGARSATRQGRLRPRRRAALLVSGAFSAAMVATSFAPAHADAAGAPVSPGEMARPSADHHAMDVAVTVSAVPSPGDDAVTVLEVEVRSDRPQRACVLQLTTAEGDVIEACRWAGAPSVRVVFSGDIPLAAAEIRSVEILGADGALLAQWNAAE